MTEDEARSRPRAVDENPVPRREASRRLRPVEDAPLPEKVEKSRRLNVMRAGDAPLPSPPTTLPPEWLPPKADPLRPQAFVPAADPPSTTTPLEPVMSPPQRPSRALIAIAVASVIGVIGIGVAVAVVPSTAVHGSQRFSHADQLVLAEVWKFRGLESWGGRHPSPELQAAVSDVARTVMSDAATEVIVVVAPGSVHGFALPDGTVVLTTGLLWRLESDAELAAVIAHLAAHQRLGHVARLLDEPAALAERAAAALAVAGPERSADDVEVLLAVASVAATSPNSGDNERDADAVAATALVEAGWDASALARLPLRAAPPAALAVQHPAPPLRTAPLSTLPPTGRVDVERYRTRIRAVLDRRRGTPETAGTPATTSTTPVVAPPSPSTTPVVAPTTAPQTTKTTKTAKKPSITAKKKPLKTRPP